jgi:Zn-dependent protease with chaperone function
MFSINNEGTNKPIEPWMFRVPGEFINLIISLLLVLLTSIFLASLNIYLFLFFLGLGLILIKFQQIQYMGNAVRVHEDQFGDLFIEFKEQAKFLGISKAALFIKQDPYLNASTIGFTYPSIVLSSKLVEELSNEELSFVLAHELGHFKAGHTQLLSLVSPLGNNNLISNLLFGLWSRKTEYTADRCGLLLTKDIDTALDALVKISIGNKLFNKINTEGYIKQLRTANRKQTTISELVTSSTHPFTTNRIINLVLFWNENFMVKSELNEQV